MKTIKRIISLLLVITTLFIFSGCGDLKTDKSEKMKNEVIESLYTKYKMNFEVISFEAPDSPNEAARGDIWTFNCSPIMIGYKNIKTTVTINEKTLDMYDNFTNLYISQKLSKRMQEYIESGFVVSQINTFEQNENIADINMTVENYINSLSSVNVSSYVFLPNLKDDIKENALSLWLFGKLLEEDIKIDQTIVVFYLNQYSISDIENIFQSESNPYEYFKKYEYTVGYTVLKIENGKLQGTKQNIINNYKSIK